MGVGRCRRPGAHQAGFRHPADRRRDAGTLVTTLHRQRFAGLSASTPSAAGTHKSAGCMTRTCWSYSHSRRSPSLVSCVQAQIRESVAQHTCSAVGCIWAVRHELELIARIQPCCATFGVISEAVVSSLHHNFELTMRAPINFLRLPQCRTSCSSLA